MTRHPAAMFTLGAIAGALLAILLTQPATSRQTSRPAATILATLRPVAPLRTGAPIDPDVAQQQRAPAPPEVAGGNPAVGANVGAPTPAVVASPTPRPEAEPAPLESDLRAGGRPALSTPGPTHSQSLRVPAKPSVRPSEPRRGVASWVAASYGADYLAARLPRGTRLRICGPAGCVTGTVNDYGPSKRIHPERIVDLSRSDFARCCGDPAMGVCDVRVSVR